MLLNLPHVAILTLCLLGGLLVTCIFKVLAMRSYYILETHDRVRESRRLRAEYMRSSHHDDDGEEKRY